MAGTFTMQPRAGAAASNGFASSLQWRIPMRHRTAGTLLAFACLVAAAPALAQEAAPALTPAARAEVIEALVDALDRGYVFPDKAAAVGRDLRSRLARGEYDIADDAGTFARVLTEQLQALTRDRHLRVRVGRPGPAGPPASAQPAAAGPFGRTERLAGDVAYVEITSFAFPAERVRERTAEVMSAAADASALIIDLRRNGGGTPDMVALVSSYLFGDDPVHLNSLWFRPTDRTDDFYTDPRVAGRKFGPAKPVYVLTSARTFSAAEEFTYNLQARGRATIVGETTGGGAHPGGIASLPHGLTVFVPSGRAINPITKTNWEGTGVRPEVAVPADSALIAALALQRRRAAPAR
jgi:hypothetical protein